MKLTKIIPIKWIDEHHDSDWDNVPNYRDCQPFNPNRQGRYHTSRRFIKSTYYEDPSMRKDYDQREKQINIYLTKNIVRLNAISKQLYGKNYLQLNFMEKAAVKRAFFEG